MSSSPRSTHASQGGADFPRVTLLDNAACQKRLLEERLGIESVALAMGWSMGAQQAYHFAALFPDRVRALLAVCGSARTSPHNWVFPRGGEGGAPLCSRIPSSAGGATRGRRRAGSRRSAACTPAGPTVRPSFARISTKSWGYLLAAWRCSTTGPPTIGPAKRTIWLGAMLASWQAADISDNATFGSDFPRALGAIRARTIVMPCRTDLYFPPEDSALEVSHMPSAELRILDSDWGHVAGGPDRNPQGTAAVERAIADLLA